MKQSKKPINQSINQSIEPPKFERSVNQSSNRSKGQPINRAIDRSIKQPLNQSIKHPLNQPINRSNYQSIKSSDFTYPSHRILYSTLPSKIRFPTTFSTWKFSFIRFVSFELTGAVGVLRIARRSRPLLLFFFRYRTRLRFHVQTFQCWQFDRRFLHGVDRGTRGRSGGGGFDCERLRPHRDE